MVLGAGVVAVAEADADKFVPFGSACRRCLVVLVVIHGEEPLSVALRDLKFLSHLLVHALKDERSEEHTSELQSLMRISYAVFCLKKKNKQQATTNSTTSNKQ